MHELSIADAIVRIALRHADGRPVSAVEVSVGHLRQVVPSSLRFSFELLTHDTPLQGARLELHEITPRGRCRDCGTETELPGFPLRCERCGGLDLELLRGEELTVEAIEILDADTTPHEESRARDAASHRPRTLAQGRCASSPASLADDARTSRFPAARHADIQEDAITIEGMAHGG